MAIPLRPRPHPAAAPALVETITPGRAATWLAHAAPNRRIERSHVEALKRQMRRCTFRVTGEAIKFNRVGELIDGQHRLTACVETGVTIECYVVRGLPDDVALDLDQCRKRRPGEVLQLQEKPNANRLAATLRALWRLEQGMTIVTLRTGRNNPMPSELDEVHERHPGVDEAVARVRAVGWLPHPTVVTLLLYSFLRLDRPLALTFMHQLATGDGLDRRHPVAHLRQQIMVAATTRRRLERADFAAWIIRAWNALREGRTRINRLYGRGRGDDSRLTFPEIR